MPNYQNTIIYKLINYDCPEHVYVGSTTNWVKRKQHHKHSKSIHLFIIHYLIDLKYLIRSNNS